MVLTPKVMVGVDQNHITIQLKSLQHDFAAVVSKTINIENEAVVPLAAAYLILIHLTPSLLSRSLPIFRLGKSADGWNRHRWRDAGGQRKRKRGRKSGEGEEETSVRRRHRQFNGRISRHKIWRPPSGRFSEKSLHLKILVEEFSGRYSLPRSILFQCHRSFPFVLYHPFNIDESGFKRTYPTKSTQNGRNLRRHAIFKKYQKYLEYQSSNFCHQLRTRVPHENVRLPSKNGLLR